MLKNIFKKSILIILILAVVFTISQSTQITLASTLDINTNEFSATIESTGKIEVLPDLAEPNIQIEYIDISKSESQNKCEQISENVQNYLKNIGIDEKEISINNTYTYSISQYGDEAYKTCTNLTFKTKDLNNLEQILNGLNTQYVKICNINYYNSEYDSHYIKALTLAENNALLKAQALYPDREIVLKEVHELNNYYPICMYREYNAKSLYIDINKPLEIEAKVSITILVK